MQHIHVRTNYFTHRKTLQLKALLGHPHADIYPPRLWAWAKEHAPSGDLTGMSPAVLAAAAGWPEGAPFFLDAMVAAGFLDLKGSTLTIHDWPEHSGRGWTLAVVERERGRTRRKMRPVGETDVTRTRTGRGLDALRTPMEPQVNTLVAGQEIPESAPRENPGICVVNNKGFDLSNVVVDERPAPVARHVEALFGLFWTEYPRKEGRGAAVKSFARAMKECRDQGERVTRVERMLLVVRAKSRSEQWQDKKLIPHPSTWLNQRRWEDTPPELEEMEAKAKAAVEPEHNPEFSALRLWLHVTEGRFRPDEWEGDTAADKVLGVRGGKAQFRAEVEVSRRIPGGYESMRRTFIKEYLAALEGCDAE